MPKNIEILVVENSHAQLERMMEVLERSDYRVRPFTKSESALKSLRKTKPQMVITDVAMTGIDGYELCRIIKAEPALQNIPVVLLASLADPAEVLRGMEAGADNFIIKPFDEKYLISRLRNIVENQIVEGSKKSHSGYEVIFNGRRFFVTAERHKILELLLSTYEAASIKNKELQSAQVELQLLNDKLEALVEERTLKLKAEMNERKEAEERVREQAALLDKARDAITVIDTQGRLTYWNEGADRLYGWSGCAMKGKKIEALIMDGTGSAEFAAARSAVLQGGDWRGEMIQGNAAGDAIVVQSRWSLVRDAKGKPKSILMISTDITEQKRLEMEFLRAQRLHQLGALAGDIAHDLNNILSPVVMGLSLLQQEFPDHGWLLDSFQQCAQRGAEMVQQILVFSRGTGTKQKKLEVETILRELDCVVQNSFPKNITIRKEALSRPLTVRGVAPLIHQVLLNLCTNARESMPEGGEMVIATEEILIDGSVSSQKSKPDVEMAPGAYVMITVSDTGCGMPGEIREKIFRPFFTTDPHRGRTGLGLSTALAIVKSHGGFMDVESAPGAGSRFRVYLPSVSGTTDAPAESPFESRQLLLPGWGRERVSSQKVAEASLPLGDGQCVLVIDDERSVREITAATLEAFGYRALIAASGTVGVELCAQNAAEEIQVVVTDMVMPGMDGRDTIAALKEINPDLKIIAASGVMDRSKITGDLEQLIDGFLSKPFTAEALITTVGNVLKMAGH